MGLTCPETEDSIASPMNVLDDEEDDLLGPGSPTLSLELEERELQSLLDSPTPSPLPILAPSTPQPSTSYASSDLCDRMTAEQLAAMKQKAKDEEEARQARKRAKKAEKKKKSKEVKRQKKAMQPLGFDWPKDKETEEAAAMPTPTPRPSTSSSPAAPPTPAPRTLAPYTIPRRTPSTPTPASSSKIDTPMSKKKKIASLMDLVVENPYAHSPLLESPPPPATPGPIPPGTPQHSSRPSRTTLMPTGSKRDRSRSASDLALGQNDLRHNLSNPVKRPKFVEPPPPPKPSPLRSRNPSALLVIGQ